MLLHPRRLCRYLSCPLSSPETENQSSCGIASPWNPKWGTSDRRFSVALRIAHSSTSIFGLPLGQRPAAVCSIPSLKTTFEQSANFTRSWVLILEILCRSRLNMLWKTSCKRMIGNTSSVVLRPQTFFSPHCSLLLSVINILCSLWLVTYRTPLGRLWELENGIGDGLCSCSLEDSDEISLALSSLNSAWLRNTASCSLWEPYTDKALSL